MRKHTLYASVILIIQIALSIICPPAASYEQSSSELGTGLMDHSEDDPDLESFVINVQIPKKLIQNLSITDIVPKGLIYVEDSLSISTNAYSPRVTVSSPNDGSQPVTVNWNFGRVYNHQGEGFSISFKLVAANTDSNREGAVLGSNTAYLSWQGTDGKAHTTSNSSDSIEVVEPSLNAEIQGSQIDGKAGDEIAYTVRLYHLLKNGADAFNADLYLIMPAGMTYSPGSLKVESGPWGSSQSSTPSMIICHFDELDQSWNDQKKVTIRYNASVNKDIQPERVLFNNATLAWASATGTNARQYTNDVKAQLNITSRSAHVMEIEVARADLQEAVSVGGTLNYRVTCRNIGNCNETNITIDAEYDQNLTFISSNPDPCGPAMNISWRSSCMAPLGLLCPGQSESIDIALRVNESLKSGSVLTSRFYLKSDEGEAQCTVNTEVEKDIPNLRLTIEPSKKAAKVGDSINYTYNISNKGKSTLFNLTLQDDLLGEIELANQSLSPGEREIARAQYLVTEADLPGPITDSAIAKGFPEADGDEAEVTEASAAVKIASINLTKSADREAASEGDSVKLFYAVRNTGSTDIMLINLTDVGAVNISPQPYGMVIPQGGSEEFLGWLMLSSKDGPEMIRRNAVAYGQDDYGNTVSAESTLESKVSPIVLAVTADKASAMAGERVNYTYVVENDGQENLTLKSLIDDKVEIISPEPSCLLITPGQNVTFEGNCTVPSSMESPLVNNATAVAVNSKGDEFFAMANFSLEIGTQEVKALLRQLYVEGGLWINKSADKSHVYPGKYLNYTINYRNDFKTEVDKVVIIDTLPDVEFWNASIEPYLVNGNQIGWNIGDLPSGGSGCIKVHVRVPDKPIMDYKEGSSVSGEGYCYVRKELSTERDGYPLINRVNMSGYLQAESRWVDAANSTEVTVDNIIGTKIRTVEHGSGYSESEQIVSFNTSGDRIALDKDINASYRPTSFSLPNQRKIDYKSRWSDRTIAKSHIRSEVVVESYQYMDSIEKSSSFYVDENQTIYKSTGTFSGGIAHMGYVKHAANSSRTTTELSEDYHGSFHVKQSLDSYGSNVAHRRSASGEGFVSTDRQIERSQRSYEHGSGWYQSEELLDQKIIYKNSTMAYAPNLQIAGNIPIRYASMWGEGMSARDSQYKSRITESIRYADYIQKESFMGTSFLTTTGRFQGYAQLKAEVPDRPKSNRTVLVDEALAGDFRLDASISAYRAPVYIYPHMNLTIKALKQDGDTVLYRINVTNDGNKTLEPVEVVDMLPRGSLFINSSLRPDSIEDGRVKWTLIILPIGKQETIDVTVRLKDTASAAINKVEARGHYDGREVKEEAGSVIVLDWLPCDLNKLEPGEYPVKKEGVSNRFESGDWQPPECMGVAINNSGCFADRRLQIYDIYGQSQDSIYEHLSMEIPLWDFIA